MKRKKYFCFFCFVYFYTCLRSDATALDMCSPEIYPGTEITININLSRLNGTKGTCSCTLITVNIPVNVSVQMDISLCDTGVISIEGWGYRDICETRINVTKPLELGQGQPIVLKSIKNGATSGDLGVIVLAASGQMSLRCSDPSIETPTTTVLPVNATLSTTAGLGGTTASTASLVPAIVGGTVGVFILLLIVIAIIICEWQRRKGLHKAREANATSSIPELERERTDPAMTKYSLLRTLTIRWRTSRKGVRKRGTLGRLIDSWKRRSDVDDNASDSSTKSGKKGTKGRLNSSSDTESRMEEASKKETQGKYKKKSALKKSNSNSSTNVASSQIEEEDASIRGSEVHDLLYVGASGLDANGDLKQDSSDSSNVKISGNSVTFKGLEDSGNSSASQGDSAVAFPTLLAKDRSGDVVGDIHYAACEDVRIQEASSTDGGKEALYAVSDVSRGGREGVSTDEYQVNNQLYSSEGQIDPVFDKDGQNDPIYNGSTGSNINENDMYATVSKTKKI